MPDVRRGTLLNVETAVFFRAICASCEEAADADGAEYQGTPDEAIMVAERDGFSVCDDGLLRCEECARERLSDV